MLGTCYMRWSRKCPPEVTSEDMKDTTKWKGSVGEVKFIRRREQNSKKLQGDTYLEP